MAVAHFFGKRFEETVRLTRRILDDVPTHNIAHRYLAAALAHLGRLDEAAVVASAMLKGQPSWTLRTARTATFQHAWMLELYVEGLRNAGLPE
jgi:adenylate cyclase